MREARIRFHVLTLNEMVGDMLQKLLSTGEESAPLPMGVTGTTAGALVAIGATAIGADVRRHMEHASAA